MGQKKDENTKEEKKSESGLRYYLPTDVVLHNKPNDIWVSFLGKVCNITPLVKEYKGRRELKPLLAYAGKDISHWFDKRTQDVSCRPSWTTVLFGGSRFNITSLCFR